MGHLARMQACPFLPFFTLTYSTKLTLGSINDITAAPMEKPFSGQSFFKRNETVLL